MTSGDLKFEAMYTNFNRVPPLPKMNPQAKYSGYIARIITDFYFLSLILSKHLQLACARAYEVMRALTSIE